MADAGKIVGAAFGAVGTGVSVYGKIKGARAQLDADRATAELMRIQADQTIVKGRQESSALVADYLNKLNDKVGDFATRNIDVNGDVAKIVQNQTLEVSRIDSDQIKKNALADAQTLQNQASNLIDSSEAAYHAAIIEGAGAGVNSLGTVIGSLL